MVSFVSFAFISALIFMIYFLLWILMFFISSLSSCFRCRVRLFIWLCLVSWSMPVLLWTFPLALLSQCPTGFGLLCFHFHSFLCIFFFLFLFHLFLLWFLLFLFFFNFYDFCPTNFGVLLLFFYVALGIKLGWSFKDSLISWGRLVLL